MNTQDKIALLRKLHGECAESICGPHTVKLTVEHKPTLDFILAAHNHLPDVLAECEDLRGRLENQTQKLSKHIGEQQAEIEKLRAALINIQDTPNGCPKCNYHVRVAKTALGESK